LRRSLPTGKIPVEILDPQLAGLRTPGADVVIGPAVGEDAAVIRPERGALIAAKSDPITLAGHEMGRYLVQVNANDLAVMGARPRWLLLTVLLPPGRMAAHQFASIMREVRRACDEAGIALVGGHSEVTDGLSRPVAVGAMLGEITGPRLLDKRAIRPGDELFLTGSIAVEGTAILARDFGPALRARGRVAKKLLRRAGDLLHDPGISIVREAGIAAGVGRVKALHDPTEGGIVAAVLELGHRSGCGVLLEADAVPVLPETQAICRALGLDPLRLLASGALLIAAAPGCGEALATAFAGDQVGVTRIGRFLARRRGSWAITGGERIPLRAADRDELARARDQLLCPAGSGTISKAPTASSRDEPAASGGPGPAPVGRARRVPRP
jgi:hydrogenase expression/formation protein HypE